MRNSCLPRACVVFFALVPGLLFDSRPGSAEPIPNLRFGPPYIVTGGFSHPYGLAVDAAGGRLLVADTGHHRFKWTQIDGLTGSYTFAEHGYFADRSNPAALTDPQGIAADADGNVYVVNTLVGEVKLYRPSGQSYALDPEFCRDNPRVVEGLAIRMPRDIAIRGTEIFLLDSGNQRILKADGPDDHSWSVHRSDPSWNNPYGLGIDPISGRILVADTGNHRIVEVGATAVYGHWGAARGELRFPRDVAVDRYGRIFVADTFNHRIQVWAADGRPLLDLGRAPGVATLEKIVVDEEDRVFALDSDRHQVLAFLGASVPAPFDPWIRDFTGDPGAEPSNDSYQLSSPDVLVRYQPDVDLEAAAAAGLESYAFQQPRFGQTNYVYVAVRNRGTQPASDNFVRLYWIDPASAERFPQDWHEEGFFIEYADATHNTPGNALSAPLIEPGGVMVRGPVLWRPPLIARDSILHLSARITNPYDYPPDGATTTAARDSNNVGERRVLVLRPPFTSGEQNTLFLRVHYPDLAAETDPLVVEARANELAAWVAETSWGVATVNAFHRGPIVLPHPRSHYTDAARSLLVEMTQDALQALLEAEPTVLDGPEPGREIGRVVLVTNDLEDISDRATTGAWPYLLEGSRRYLSVSVQGGNNPAPLFYHGLAHQLGLIDLYAHENVTFPRPYVDGWDTMAKPINGAHPLIWSKELAQWVTNRGARIKFVPRPAPGTTWNNGGRDIPFYYQETAEPGQTVGIAFGLTHGVTAFNEETAFYYVEARTRAAGGADEVLPDTGVLMYYANLAIPQGQGPVILRDHNPSPGLEDAAIKKEGTESPAGTGITVTVKRGIFGAPYLLEVSYTPPASDYDVFMEPGDPPWRSPDIWVDNQADGYEEEEGHPPSDQGNQGIAGEENRVYARVRNTGPAQAFDVEVVYLFSEPYHTVGGAGDFEEYRSVFVDQVPFGGSTTPYVNWTPVTGVSPHTCARVELRRLFNDINAENNRAQRNLQIDHSVHGSPYAPVEFQFQVRNEDVVAKPVYFRAEGIPSGWDWSISPPRVFLASGESAYATLTVQPPPDAPDCTSHAIQVTGWIPRGDTLIRLGGSTLQLHLQQETRIEIKPSLEKCRPRDLLPEEKRRIESASPSIRSRVPGGFVAPELESEARWTPRLKPESCARIRVTGCTDPPQPNQEIQVRYEAPDGTPYYQTVTTDANGCFEDSRVLTEGGTWETKATFSGTDCAGPVAVVATLDVPLPEKGHLEDGPDPDRRLCITSFSLDLDGASEARVKEGAKARKCRTEAYLQPVRLHNKASPAGPALMQLAGDLELFDLRHLVVEVGEKGGLLRGRFRWKVGSSLMVGDVEGLEGLGSHHGPASPGSERGAVPRHWELSLQGTIVEGEALGDRVQGVLTLDHARPDPQGLFEVRGVLEGLIERDCLLTDQERKRRAERARADAQSPGSGACNGLLPCLERIAKLGNQGDLILDQTGRDRCEKPDCATYKSWSRLEVPLQGDASVEGASPFIADGRISATLVQVLERDPQGRGEHFGTFKYAATDGTRVGGRLFGITRGGTHRNPAAKDLEPYDAAGHLEGHLTGVILNGDRKGARIDSRYVLQIPEGKDRRRPVKMTLDGWGVVGCLEAAIVLEERKEEHPPEVQPGPALRRIEVTRLSDKQYRSLRELPPAALKAVRRAVGGKLTTDEENDLRIADRRFRDADADQDGKLSLLEFTVLYRPAGAPDRLPRALLATDSNRDGRLSESELGSAWKGLEPLDADQDGRITAAEWRKSHELFAKRGYDHADSNRDSSIDFAEFALWWRTLPKVLLSKRAPE
jgi:DNA-binding beta-propeller fold protein YncE